MEELNNLNVIEEKNGFVDQEKREHKPNILGWVALVSFFLATLGLCFLRMATYVPILIIFAFCGWALTAAEVHHGILFLVGSLFGFITAMILPLVLWSRFFY